MPPPKVFSFESWIHACVNNHPVKDVEHPDKPARCTKIAVCHMRGERSHEIYTADLDGTQSNKQLSDLLRYKAEEFCSEMVGRQSCCLQAFYEGHESGPLATRPFQVDGQYGVPGENGNGLMTESPTTTGLAQQAMRHMEMTQQHGHAQMASLHSNMLRFNEQLMSHAEFLARQNEKLHEENAEAINVVKEVLMAQADKSQEHRMAQLKAVQDAAERKKWLEMAPMLLNTVLGREVIPFSAADTNLLETIVKNTTEQDIMKLATVFQGKETLMGPLMVRFMEIQAKLDKEKAREEEAQRLALSDGDDLPDEGGGVPQLKQ